MHSVCTLSSALPVETYADPPVPPSLRTEFMPLTGEWIVSSLERRLPRELARLWSFQGDVTRLDKSRGEGPIVRKMLPDAKQAKL